MPEKRCRTLYFISVRAHITINCKQRLFNQMVFNEMNMEAVWKGDTN